MSAQPRPPSFNRARVLLLQAGSAAACNVLRSLRAGNPRLFIAGCNRSSFILKKSGADRNYLLPISILEQPRALREIVARDRIDVVIPTSDRDVADVSKIRRSIGCSTFLPAARVIEQCQDKYALTRFLRARGIPAPRTYALRKITDLPKLFAKFRGGTKLWCRIRRGSGSLAAIPVKTVQQAKSWIEYWEQMRSVEPVSFTLAEYLPGRDFCVQSLWNRGRLVLAKMAQRLIYLPTNSPSGVSSMPALATTAFDERALDVSARAIRALDRRASGVFFVDIKESSDGTPCITEINVGRFATMTNIHDLAGKHNMAATFVQLALGKDTGISEPYDYVADYSLVRSVDTEPLLVGPGEVRRNIIGLE